MSTLNNNTITEIRTINFSIKFYLIIMPKGREFVTIYIRKQLKLDLLKIKNGRKKGKMIVYLIAMYQRI